MSISYNGYKNNTLTMENGGVTLGYPVSINSNGKAVDAAANSDFIGICVAVRGDICSVQTDGYVEFNTTKLPGYGYSGFVADGNGSVTSSDAKTASRAYTVVKLDNTNKIVGFIM